MKLIDWLSNEEATGKTVKIGAKDGNGFVLAGRVDDELINRAITLPKTAGTGKKGKKGLNPDDPNDYSNVFYADRDVAEVSPSEFADFILLIDGNEYGHEDLPPELERQYDLNAVPLERYIEFGNAVIASAVDDLKHAYVDAVMRPTERARDEAEKNVLIGERAIHSTEFKTLQPNADPDRVIELIRDKADSEILVSMIDTFGMDTVNEVRALDRRTIAFLQTFEPALLSALGAGNGKGGQIIRDASDDAIRAARMEHYERVLEEQKKQKRAER